MRLDHHARTENVRFLAATGENLSGAAKRLGLRPEALDKWCRRWGLMAELDALREREASDLFARERAQAAAASRWVS